MQTTTFEPTAGQQQLPTTTTSSTTSTSIPAPSRNSLDMREIGDEATWTLSSAKPGNGAVQLRDGNTSTYWQSDGPQPHIILIQFHKRVSLLELALYLDVALDESYTPRHIKVCAGTTRYDLENILDVELNEPMGWTVLSLRKKDAPLKTYCLRISFITMHQNGRDTHVRLIRLFGPRNRQLVNTTSSITTATTNTTTASTTNNRINSPSLANTNNQQQQQRINQGRTLDTMFSETSGNIAGFTLR
jgi:anaphase-promoting complex subunit 10